jgi:predicted  nucleic acid-binding Zn-ribbon protein
MRNDMQCLVVLWRIERKIQRFREEYYQFKDVVDRRSKSISSIKKELQELDHKRITRVSTVQKLEKDIKKTESRIKSLQNAMESGVVSDFNSAEKQMTDTKVLLDKYEEHYLTELDDEELENTRTGVLTTRLEADQRLLQTESSHFEINRVRLEKNVQTLREEQRTIADTMNPNVVDVFKRKIAKHPQAVSPIHTGHCSHCRMMLPKMMVNDVLIREVIHTCPSCSTFLISSDEII